MQKSYILAVDAGTTSNRAILFDRAGRRCASSQEELTQSFPKPGWVEHDAEEIAASVRSVISTVMQKEDVSARQIAAMGISNQRETTVLWDRRSGRPIAPAIVWQDRRTASYCQRLVAEGVGDYIREKTGLVVDAYFSATKIAWMLDHISGARGKAERGELCFGTVDTWLLWQLTRGAVFATDYSNASRTMLYDISEKKWNDTILKSLDIPASILPEVRTSSEVYGSTELFGSPIPIAGMAGDQQAALFGQACFEHGMAKNTYGTGSFILMNTGEKPVPSGNGLLTTMAWGMASEVEYALEGSVFVTGAAVQWLRDELGVVSDAAESEDYARRVPDTQGVYVVPAFAGLGAPYWDMQARGCIVGLTRGANKYHLVRATLESIAYQVRDVLDCMEKDSGIAMKALRVDGGAAANDFLLQFQADMLGREVHRPKIVEATARGSAYLAGLAVGYWKDRQEIAAAYQIEKIFVPRMSEEQRDEKYEGWKRAVDRARNWEHA